MNGEGPARSKINFKHVNTTFQKKSTVPRSKTLSRLFNWKRIPSINGRSSGQSIDYSSQRNTCQFLFDSVYAHENRTIGASCTIQINFLRKNGSREGRTVNILTYQKRGFHDFSDNDDLI